MPNMKTVLDVIGNETIANQLLYGFMSCNDLPELYEALYNYYAFDLTEMPYGVMKARTGDPVDWIDRRVVQDLEALADSPREVEY
jgi:hypothetical protein